MTYQLWEINWGFQYTDQRFVEAEHWDSGDFGGLTYIDSQNSGNTPAEELEAVRVYEARPEPKQAYHWWYPTRDMVEKGSELTLGFKDGDVILGEVMVGSDKCPSVRWTHFPSQGEPVTTTPPSFPLAPQRRRSLSSRRARRSDLWVPCSTPDSEVARVGTADSRNGPPLCRSHYAAGRGFGLCNGIAA